MELREFMAPINVGLKAQELSGRYENVVLSQTNDHVVRISSMTEPYFWHLHPDSDETFIAIRSYVTFGDARKVTLKKRPR